MRKAPATNSSHVTQFSERVHLKSSHNRQLSASEFTHKQLGIRWV